MPGTLNLTIVYEQDPDSDWMMASIPELQGVRSQGHTREEAREMVLSALNDWLRFYIEDHGNDATGLIPAGADTEPVHLNFAA